MRTTLLFFYFILSVYSILHAQTFQVFQTDSEGKKGKILRLETYNSGQLIQQKIFGEKTQPITTIQLKYTKNGLIKERKQTFHQGTEYDLIRQYTYDDDGFKIGELFGNNRTGKWGSHRYSYTAMGVVDTIFVFQKNGDLTDLRIIDYTYDAKNRKTKEVRANRKVESGKTTPRTIITYDYPDVHTVKTTIRQADGTIISEELVRSTDFGAIAESTTQLPKLGTLRVVNYYDDRQQMIKTKAFENGQLVKTTTYQYDDQGQIKQRQFIEGNGQILGELYKLVEQ